MRSWRASSIVSRPLTSYIILTSSPPTGNVFNTGHDAGMLDDTDPIDRSTFQCKSSFNLSINSSYREAAFTDLQIQEPGGGSITPTGIASHGDDIATIDPQLLMDTSLLTELRKFDRSLLSTSVYLLAVSQFCQRSTTQTTRKRQAR